MATLTASTSLQIKEELKMLFPVGTQNRNQHVAETPIASALLGKQTFRTQPVFENGQCVAFEAWFPDLTDLDTALGAISSTAPTVADCHLTACPTIGSAKLTYSANMFAPECGSVSDDDCGNDFKFVDKMSETLAQLVRRMENKIELEIATRLFAQVSAPLANDPGASAGYVINATSIDVSTINWTLDLLPKLMTSAQFNRMGDNLVFLESGSLAPQMFGAAFYGQNDDQRSLLGLASAFREMITIDTRNLFGVLGGHGGLLVNADQFGFFNQTQFSNTTVSGSVPLSQVAGFKVASRRLFYQRNTVGADGRRVNSLAPVEFDVLYEKVCNATNSALGWTNHTHTLKLRLTAGFVAAPPASNGKANATGVIHFDKV